MHWPSFIVVLLGAAVSAACLACALTWQYYYKVRLTSGGTVPARTMGCGNGEQVLVYVNQKEMDMLKSRSQLRRALRNLLLPCYGSQ